MSPWPCWLPSPLLLVYVIHFPIFPAASFLEYDPADIPILIGTFAYGPLAGFC
ncbi:MAG: hypothetical protein ACLR1T_18100 [Evtepia gabavorous]